MSPEQKTIERITARLRAGHGVEDIAIDLSLDLATVKRVTQRLRENGNFDDPFFFLPMKRKSRRGQF